MINNTTIDTVPPPTWDGTPVSGLTPTIDAATALRAIVGDDKLNYWNFQRAEGDLHNRDLAIFLALKTLVDHLSTRSGIVFSSPSISLLAGTHLPLGRFGGLIAEVPQYLTVALACYLDGGGTDGDVGIRIVRVSDSLLMGSSTAKDEEEWSVPALSPTDTRGVVLSGASQMEVQLYNDSAGTVVAQGFAIVCPRNHS